MSKKISLISIAYLLIYFFPTCLMILFILFGFRNLGVEIALLYSFIAVTTQIFSSNMRNLIVSRNNDILAQKAIKFRILLLLPIFLISIIFLINILEVNNIVILILYSLIFILFWIFELILAVCEIKNHIKKINSFIIISAVFGLFTLLAIGFELNQLLNLSAFMYLIYLSFSSYEIINIKSKFFDIKGDYLGILKINVLSKSFISSFSFVFSNFIWRSLLVFFLGKVNASVYIFAFAIASLPGSIINNFAGLIFLKNKFNLKIIYKYFYFLSLFIIVIITLNLDSILDFAQIKYLRIYFEIIFISLIGTFLMCIGMFKRILMIKNIINKNDKVFEIDFFYGIIICLIIPFLFYIHQDYLKFAYLISSLFSFLFYSLGYKFFYGDKSNK